MDRRRYSVGRAAIRILQVPKLPAALKLASGKRISRKEKHPPITTAVHVADRMRDRDRQFIDTDNRIVRRIACLPDLAVGLSLLGRPFGVIEIPAVQRVLRFRNGHWDVITALGCGNVRGPAEPCVARHPEPLPVRIEDGSQVVEAIDGITSSILKIQTGSEKAGRANVIAERVTVLVVVPETLPVRDDHMRA